MSIGSKHGKLEECHFHSLRMQDRSWVQRGMIQEGEEGLLPVSKHKDLLVGFCCHR